MSAILPNRLVDINLLLLDTISKPPTYIKDGDAYLIHNGINEFENIPNETIAIYNGKYNKWRFLNKVSSDYVDSDGNFYYNNDGTLTPYTKLLKPSPNYTDDFDGAANTNILPYPVMFCSGVSSVSFKETPGQTLLWNDPIYEGTYIPRGGSSNRYIKDILFRYHSNSYKNMGFYLFDKDKNLLFKYTYYGVYHCYYNWMLPDHLRPSRDPITGIIPEISYPLSYYIMAINEDNCIVYKRTHTSSSESIVEEIKRYDNVSSSSTVYFRQLGGIEYTNNNMNRFPCEWFSINGNNIDMITHNDIKTDIYFNGKRSGSNIVENGQHWLFKRNIPGSDMFTPGQANSNNCGSIKIAPTLKDHIGRFTDDDIHNKAIIIRYNLNPSSPSCNKIPAFNILNPTDNLVVSVSIGGFNLSNDEYSWYIKYEKPGALEVMEPQNCKLCIVIDLQKMSAIPTVNEVYKVTILERTKLTSPYNIIADGQGHV